MAESESGAKEVGTAVYAGEEMLSLEDVTPKLTKPWFMYSNLRQLNFLLVGGLLAQVVSGYDGEY
jgi:hypothetical protein